MIEVQHVSVDFKMANDKIQSLKEYSVALLTHRLRTQSFRALNDISFSVRRGEVLGLIGHNGAGKSTLLKVISGILKPSEGTVRLGGPVVPMLELGSGFDMDLNGRENIFLNGAILGYSETFLREKYPEIVTYSGLEQFMAMPLRNYSSGMLARLAFSIASVVDPEILIVDEALSVGDVFFQAKCYHKFEEFKKMGKTIMIVSHDLSSIAKYCDRVILLNQGIKLGEGAPKEMIDDFKRVLVGQYELPASKSEQSLLNDADVQEAVEKDIASKKKSKDAVNTLEYGTQEAEIEEFYILDDRGIRTNAVIKGAQFSIHMRVRFNNDLPAPIFAFSIKTAKGTEITGTNTMFEKAFLEPVKAGAVKEVCFTQKMSLQGGSYLISFGVTGYNGNDFQVYHRLYDALDVTVISDKDTVGYYDMDSKVTVTDAKME